MPCGLKSCIQKHTCNFIKHFLQEKSFLDVALEKDFDDTHQCRMTTASETFFTAGFAFVVQKGCDFLELLDKEYFKNVIIIKK